MNLDKKKSKKNDNFSFDKIKKLIKNAESNLSIIEENLGMCFN